MISLSFLFRFNHQIAFVHKTKHKLNTVDECKYSHLLTCTIFICKLNLFWLINFLISVVQLIFDSGSYLYCVYNVDDIIAAAAVVGVVVVEVDEWYSHMGYFNETPLQMQNLHAHNIPNHTGKPAMCVIWWIFQKNIGSTTTCPIIYWQLLYVYRLITIGNSWPNQHCTRTLSNCILHSTKSGHYKSDGEDVHIRGGFDDSVLKSCCIQRLFLQPLQIRWNVSMCDRVLYVRARVCVYGLTELTLVNFSGPSSLVKSINQCGFRLTKYVQCPIIYGFSRYRKFDTFTNNPLESLSPHKCVYPWICDSFMVKMLTKLAIYFGMVCSHSHVTSI